MSQGKEMTDHTETQSQALWRRIGGKTGPYDLGPEEVASILLLLADEIEYRGQIGYDLDPGETSDWFRMEAHQALADWQK